MFCLRYRVIDHSKDNYNISCEKNPNPDAKYPFDIWLRSIQYEEWSIDSSKRKFNKNLLKSSTCGN